MYILIIIIINIIIIIIIILFIVTWTRKQFIPFLNNKYISKVFYYLSLVTIFKTN